MDIQSKLQLVQEKYGPWTAHNIEIAPGIFTIKEDKADRAQQRALIYAGLSTTLLKRKNIKGLKILDLGCLEGGISIALSLQGAKCTGIDVRPGHLAKAEFAAKSLKINQRCKWILGDVTDPSLWLEIGSFDIVICSGLLYHLDAQDILPTLKRINDKCKKNGMAIIDTNIAPQPKQRINIKESTFLYGCEWIEHPEDRNIEERIKHSWSSLENNKAFWLTERSLCNALIMAGFGSVLKQLYPYHEWAHQTRDIWIAMPGESNPNNLPLRADPDPRPIPHPALKIQQ